MDENPLDGIDTTQDQVPHLVDVEDGDLLDAFLAGRRPTTLRAYAKDLADFAAFLGFTTADAALKALVNGTAGRANKLALGYKAHLTGRDLAPATIARRLAALRSVAKLARTLGRVAWAIDIPSPKAEAYRDTRGPGLGGWKSLLAEARARATTPKGRRDLALVRLRRVA
jgi:integrase/recombinase XerC